MCIRIQWVTNLVIIPAREIVVEHADHMNSTEYHVGGHYPAATAQHIPIVRMVAEGIEQYSGCT